MNYGAIRSILLTVIMLSASWGAFGAVGGTAVSVILFALAAYFLVRELRWTRSIRIVAVVLGLSALVGLVLDANRSARKTAHCVQCANNLRQIGIAVQNYWDAHGCYPPACSYDEAGQPMHSWRLFIKPFLDVSGTYGYTKLNEPWDSPSNQKRLADRQIVYQCPTDKTVWKPGSTATSYVAIVGKRDMWQPVKARGTNQKLPTQADDAFLVIEMANSGIQWSEPKDIPFDDVRALKSLAAKSSHARDNGYFYRKTPAANAVLVHGDRVFVFPWDARASVLTGLVRPLDLLPPEEFEKPRRGKDRGPDSQLFEEELRVDWLHLVGLPVWMVSLGLLLYQVTYSRKLRREANS